MLIYNIVYTNDNALFIDKNECLIGNGGCSHLCHNHPGSFSCSCYGGYNLIDQFVCQGTLSTVMSYIL